MVGDDQARLRWDKLTPFLYVVQANDVAQARKDAARPESRGSADRPRRCAGQSKEP
jgi:hypothetical protein